MCEREREREKKNYLPDKNAFRREKIDFYKEGMKEWKEEGLKKCERELNKDRKRQRLFSQKTF